MAVPNIFGSATSAIPLSQLDTNFATPVTIGNTAVQLGNTVTSFGNVTLTNVTISSGNVTVTGANVSGTANVSTLIVTGNQTSLGNVAITGNISANIATFSAGSNTAPSITTTGDINTGIFFPAADTIAFSEGGVEAARIDSSGNFGLGVTPSAWKSNYKATQVGNATAVVGRTDNNNNYFSSNWFVNSSNQDIYQNTGHATIYLQGTGTHAWYTAASGTAGNAITFTQAMTLDASGNLGVGATSIGYSAKSQFVKQGSSSANNSVTDSAVLASNASGSASENIGLRLKTGAGISGISVVSQLVSAGNNAFELYTVESTPLILGTNATERARINSDGRFLIGKTTTSTANQGIVFNSNANCIFTVTDTGATDTLNVWNDTAGAYRFYVTRGGTIFATSTTISAISDIRLKENIQDLDVGLDKIMALKPRKFDWKDGKGKNIKGDRGWIAQEFEQVFPDMVSTWKDEQPEGEEPYKSVGADLIPVLVKSIQELNAKVEAQAVEIAALKGTA
jgi:hypothetical protein